MQKPGSTYLKQLAAGLFTYALGGSPNQVEGAEASVGTPDEPQHIEHPAVTREGEEYTIYLQTVRAVAVDQQGKPLDGVVVNVITQDTSGQRAP